MAVSRLARRSFPSLTRGLQKQQKVWLKGRPHGVSRLFCQALMSLPEPKPGFRLNAGICLYRDGLVWVGK